MLHGGRMYHIIDPLECSFNPVVIPYVTNKKADLWIGCSRIILRHFKLFLLIPGKYHQSFNLRVLLKDMLSKRFAQ